ncbi:MAG: GWxTD domain-containing protein [Bacteroidota bacterium]
MRALPLALLVCVPLLVAAGWGRPVQAQGVVSADADRLYLRALALDEANPRAARRAIEEAIALDPDNVRYLEVRLAQLQRELSESKAASVADTRRPRLARDILRLDPASAIALEERGIAETLNFEWWRDRHQRSGATWTPDARRGMAGRANRHWREAEQFLRNALVAEPTRRSAHLRLLRLYAEAEDYAALAQAADRFRRARPSDADIPLYQGLADFYQRDLAAAERHFDAALSDLDAPDRIAFETLDWLLDVDERERWDAAQADGRAAAYAARYWRSQDPRLLTPQNERQVEHHARLALADLLFREVQGRDAQDDRRGWRSMRGETLVRYGLPNQRIVWSANDITARDFSRYQRWVYDDFDLLFEDLFRNGDFEYATSADGDDDHTFAQSLHNRAPSRTTYAPERRVSFPYLASAFKGDGGQADVLISLGIPVERDGAASVMTGAFLIDEDYAIRAETRAAVSASAVRRETDEGLLLTDFLRLDAAAGTYDLAVEFEQRGRTPEAQAVGYRRDQVTVPDFRAPGLKLSDLLLAYHVEELDGRRRAAPGTVERRGHEIAAAPWGVFAAGRPVYLYAETYGLTTPFQDGRRQSQYAVEALLVRRDDAGTLTRFARLFVGSDPPESVAVRFEASGTTADEAQYLVLGTRNLSPGAYRLFYRVTDRHTGAEAEASRDLFLEAPTPD